VLKWRRIWQSRDLLQVRECPGHAVRWY